VKQTIKIPSNDMKPHEQLDVYDEIPEVIAEQENKENRTL